MLSCRTTDFGRAWLAKRGKSRAALANDRPSALGFYTWIVTPRPLAEVSRKQVRLEGLQAVGSRHAVLALAIGESAFRCRRLGSEKSLEKYQVCGAKGCGGNWNQIFVLQRQVCQSKGQNRVRGLSSSTDLRADSNLNYSFLNGTQVES